MDYKKVTTGLEGYNREEVLIYVNYLKFLESDKDSNKQQRNKWFNYFTADEAINIYKKVAIDHLFIDGETITLQNKGKVMVSYNYQAYKNRVLNVYPESKFDVQLVCAGDDFSFNKEDGKVIYSHKIANPFDTKRAIIGTYCIIKNSRGEFLETLDMEEIKKMKAAARTKNVWNEWFSEMVLKSVIKRACKRHFRDLVVNIERVDNELSDPSRVTVEELVQQKIEDAQTLADLAKIYKSESGSVKDRVKFMELLGERKKELMDLLPDITIDEFPKALEMLKAGKSIKDLLNIWKIDDDTQNNLLTQV